MDSQIAWTLACAVLVIVAYDHLRSRVDKVESKIDRLEEQPPLRRVVGFGT